MLFNSVTNPNKTIKSVVKKTKKCFVKKACLVQRPLPAIKGLIGVSIDKFETYHLPELTMKVLVWLNTRNIIFFINFGYRDDSIIERIKNALPPQYSFHVKGNFSSANIKTCLDNTSEAVIAIINQAYEIGKTSQADITHIFKRQFPLVIVVPKLDFEPSTSPIDVIWRASTIPKVFLDSPAFEGNLRQAITNARWNLSSSPNPSKLAFPTTAECQNRFLGGVHEWTIAYSSPAQVCQNFRQFIIDPLRITADTKLQYFYDNYVQKYFSDPALLNLFEKGVKENDICPFLQAYTCPKTNVSFSETLNRHLSANVLFYFEPMLSDTIDYQLVKCLIDFVALCIFRQELQPYLFTDTVCRGMTISEADRFKYVVGSRIMNTSFLSASKKRNVAHIFAENNEQRCSVLCTYQILNKNNRRTAIHIGEISKIPGEEEVLILPFSPFYVKSVMSSSDNPQLIEMVLAEDDSDVSQNIIVTEPLV